MKIFHFKAFYISAAASLLIGSALLFLPDYFIYAEPEQVKKSIPEIEELSELSEIPELSEIEETPPPVTDLNIWIEDNMEKSILFYTEEMTNDSRISRAIVTNSIKNGIPVNLAFSVAFKESKFKKDAYNDNGKSKDRGLFQLNDSYRQEWSIEDFYNIDKNSHEGTRYLKEMIVLNKNDIQKALYCYNAGPTKVRKYGIIPEKTKVYATEILELENNLDRQMKAWIMN
jgi:Transglycosylase SLT domain